MKKITYILVLSLLVLSTNILADIDVVATTQNIASITEMIAGDKADVKYVARGFEDPHHIIAKPSFMLMAKRADLWIRNGLELEIGWEGLILEGGRNSDIHLGNPGHLDVSAGVGRLEVPAVLDRSMGDIHPQGNPHYLLDPYNSKAAARNICDRLCELDPDNMDYYLDNLDKFNARLDRKMFGDALVKAAEPQLLWEKMRAGTLEKYLKEKGLSAKAGGWYKKMLPLRGMQYISFHQHWSYFNKSFGLDVPVYIEPKPGIPPTPSHLRRVLGIVKSRKIKLMVQAGWYSMKAANYLKEKTNIKVITLPPGVGASEKIRNYFDLFDVITDKFAKEVS